MASNPTLKDLQASLELAAKESSPDFGLILRLSSEIAKHDTQFVRFSTNTSLIKRLGTELVARQETAVSELVKNAYDADATIVKVTFSGTDKPGGRLHISDNGNGMTREQLIDGFMRLATDDKVSFPRSPRYGRRRAGQKGIGRFASHRLGRKLTVLTQAPDLDKALKLIIEWDQFDKGGELFNIPLRIEECPKSKSCGTLLIIDNLREGWTDPQISKVYRYVEALNSPFPIPDIAADDAESISRPDPGFKVSFNRMQGVVPVPIASEETMLFNFSLATVTGAVDSEGNGKFTISTPRLNGAPTIHEVGVNGNPKTPYPNLKRIRFVAHYFIYSSEFIPNPHLSSIKELSDKQGGIRLYRNGFRVLPYGEPYNDWLGLNAAESKREILPPLSNKNWLGSIELDDSSGPFEETSSREGLNESPIYLELVEFIHGALRDTALRVASLREKKGTAGQKGYKKKPKAGPPEDPLSSAASKLEELAKDNPSTAGGNSSSLYLNQSGNTVSETVKLVAEDLKKAVEEREALIEELSLMRILASLGLTIGMFTHEAKARLIAIRGEINSLNNFSNIGEEARKRLSLLRDHSRMLEAYLTYFDSMVSDSSARTLEPQNLEQLVYSFWKEFKDVFSKRNLQIMEPAAIGDDLITKPIHPSEVASILVNFLTNSAKAIKRAEANPGKIQLKLWREKDVLFLDFEDNGDGIPKENQESIFNAFFTTTHTGSSMRSDSEDLTGTGLGLKIVRDIVSSLDGEVYLVSPSSGYSTCFRVELPAGDAL